MTWQGKRRKQLPSNWGAVRKARLEYDGYRCTATVLAPFGHHQPMRCLERATEVDHHLDPHDHRLEALRSLCHTHHMAKTQAEAQAARTTRKRTTQPHPGLR